MLNNHSPISNINTPLINEYNKRPIYRTNPLKRHFPNYPNENPLLPDYLKLPLISQYTNTNTNANANTDYNERKIGKRLYMDKLNAQGLYDHCDSLEKRKRRYIHNPYIESKEYQPIKVLNTEVIEKSIERDHGIRQYDIITNMPCKSISPMHNNEERKYFSTFEKYDKRLGRSEDDPRRLLNRCIKWNQESKGSSYLMQLKQSLNPKFIK